MTRLFEPSEINGMVLPNRFVRSATWDGMAADDGACTPEMVALMARLAEGGVGLIITGHAYVHPHGQHQPWQLGIDREELMPGLQSMADAVHENGGNIVIQLGYGGAYLSKSRLRNMTHKDIKSLVASYGKAALRARRAGFDGIQIFAAHGFFLSQMLCPRYNDRTDEYGGDIRNRARMLLQITREIRNTVGSDYPVLVKLNCRDFVENGLTLDESIQVGVMLVEEGIDALELSGGLLNNPNLMKDGIRTQEDEAYFQDEARAFKKKADVPLMLVGGIRSHEIAERLVNNGTADYISMCRPFISEPDLINRWKSGDHRKSACISCNHCIEQAKKGEGICCVPVEKSAREFFFPQFTRIVPASPPHEPGTGYEVSLGIEQRDADFIPVIKVQMVFKGEALDRSLSFPLGSNDHETVNKAICELLTKHAAAPADE
jgi:2,4-dienoyl-CoA reductase-like NADH-dependent reductase (Old Yellow Enzyme family)